MYFNLGLVAAAASSLIGLVAANPHFRVSARDLFVASQCTDLNYGSTSTDIGTVCAKIVDGSLIIDYSAPGLTITQVHVWVGTQIPTGTTPGRNPGGFPYQNGDGICSITGLGTAQCVIPVQNAWRACTGQLYLATHAVVTVAGTDQTAWGNTVCWPGLTQGNCPKYWSINRTCYCKSTSFPEPVTMTSTSTTTYTSTSTTEYLTSTTSTYTTSTVIEFSTTSYSTTTITAESTTTTTSTPAPVTTTVTCLAAS